MGREIKRRQAKFDRKNNIRKNEIKEVKEKNIRDYVLIVVLLAFIFSSIYILSGLFVTKELKWFDKKVNDKNTQSVSNTILASEIFNQKEEDYYVYFYDYTESNDELSSAVKNKIYTSKIYYVDTNSALNKNYVSEQTNKNAKKLDELKVKSKTLIKISNDNITNYYEDDSILDLLK